MSSQAGRVLRQTSRDIREAAETSVDRVAKAAVRNARNAGGRMADGTPLRAKNRKVRGSGGSTRRVQGVPVGYWVIKDSGRRGDYPIKPRRGKVLDFRNVGDGQPSAVVAATQGPRTSGDKRWQRKVIEPAQDDLVREVTEQVTRATR